MIALESGGRGCQDMLSGRGVSGILFLRRSVRVHGVEVGVGVRIGVRGSWWGKAVLDADCVSEEETEIHSAVLRAQGLLRELNSWLIELLVWDRCNG